jgi:hypothetical protein
MNTLLQNILRHVHLLAARSVSNINRSNFDDNTYSAKNPD